MSILTLDSRVYTAAIKAAVKTAVGSDDVYSYGQVPGDKNNPDEAERKKPLPNIFVLLSIERMYNPNLSMAASAGSTGWRVSARGVGRTNNEAEWALFKIATALNEVRLTIGGRPTTPFQLESSQAPQVDDGRFSGTSVYTFNH